MYLECTCTLNGLVQVRYEGDPEGALVRFSATTEAKKAYECPEPILNNRFIRVYYQKSTLNLKVISVFIINQSSSQMLSNRVVQIKRSKEKFIFNIMHS